ncbi:condensin complex subunit 1 [Rhopalosiphum padi]|uniref:condensin complex subunit 1 n=1 Tax=Rhopalosiphum padi TaxID=40932 RepID=UPI00298D947B|nr:condensin complex subunit 1 [Rhopalosiphum padi]
MANKDFFIYTDRNKLRTPSNVEYRVDKLLKPKELKSSIKACYEELNSEGAQSIFKNFDKLFSVIEFIDQIDYQDLHYVYEKILVKSLNIIASFFSSYGEIEDMSLDLRHQFTNIIKMNVYLFVEFVHSFNTKFETDYKLLLLETKGRNKKQDMIQKHTSDYDWNWEDKLSIGLKAINGIISNNITQLYDPPYIDHTFVSYIATCCYIQLENPSIAFVRTKSLRDSIMQILEILITDYDHVQQFKIKVVQLLKSYEHLSLPLAKIVLQVIESGNNRSSIIELIVKEIAETGEAEGIKETNNQEITGGKSCCAFLVEIARHCPQLLLPNIDHLLPCLESDPYTMRICVLSVLKELIIHVLNNDELNELERKTRDDYIIIMQDHLLDVNAFVRSKVLQLFMAIINEDCLPKQMYGIILNCAEEKLHDKSSYVTKSAIQLIKTLIKLNPYSCDFTENKLHDKLKEENSALKCMKRMLKVNIDSEINKEDVWPSIETPLKLFLEETFEDTNFDIFGVVEISKDMELSEVIMKIKSCITSHKFKSALKYVVRGGETFKDEPLFKMEDESNLSKKYFLVLKNIWFCENTMIGMESNNIENLQQMNAEELHFLIFSTESKITYLQDCAEYLHTIKKSLNTISLLMFGNTSSESLEAIDFFTTAYKFGVPHTQAGVDAMLTLIFSSDSNIKEAMMNSYKTIYLNIDEDKDSSTTRPETIMTRLVSLIKTLNVTNRRAFKALLNEWMKNKTLDDECIMVLWAWFTKSKDISDEDQVVAALILSLIASSQPSIAMGNLESLLQYGLCDNYQLFIYSCQILESITQEDFKRFSENHELIKKVFNVVHKCFNQSDVQLFNDVASNAVNIIYKLTIQPDATCMTLIEKLYSSMIINNKNDSSQQKDDHVRFNTVMFAKFIFIIGHIALQQYDHLENYVAKELIRDVRAKYQAKKLKMDKAKEDENVHDSEAAEIEAINDRIRQICDKQLLKGSGIFSHFSKHIIKACSSNHSDLKANAIISLVKFMLVSTSFCHKQLPMFLNLIENTDNLETVIDLVSGFGWLVFRHPNLLEPCTDKLYARLHDKCNQVRYSTLMTIIDLIRQEMIKVRGQIAGIAKLLVDEDENINYTARQFFGTIAEKGNTLYNVLSDIISTLSNPEDLVPEHDFQSIMKFLLPLINKERQIESLVDKLCIRLKESIDRTQEYYISYCLMLIKYTDKSLTKLSDNISYYTDKLKNPKVYNNFNILISTNSKMAKPATKEILSELTNKIEKIVKDEDFAVPLSQKTPGKRLNTVKKKVPINIANESSEDEIEPLQLVTKRSARCRSKVKRKLIENDSEEEENDEEIARTSGVSNVQKIVNIKTNEDSETDDGKINIIKRATRQNKYESLSKKSPRHKS